jgi:predicted Zn-dependent protease
MESVINHIRATTGSQLTHQDTKTLGREIARLSLNSEFTAEEREEFRSRTNRVQNAYLSVWADSEDSILSPEQASEMERVLYGEISPETAMLPKPSMKAFRKSNELEENDALSELISEFFSRVDEAARRDTEKETQDKATLETEAEEIWNAFLDGSSITNDELLVLQHSGLL